MRRDRARNRLTVYLHRPANVEDDRSGCCLYREAPSLHADPQRSNIPTADFKTTFGGGVGNNPTAIDREFCGVTAGACRTPGELAGNRRRSLRRRERPVGEVVCRRRYVAGRIGHSRLICVAVVRMRLRRRLADRGEDGRLRPSGVRFWLVSWRRCAPSRRDRGGRAPRSCHYALRRAFTRSYAAAEHSAQVAFPTRAGVLQQTMHSPAARARWR